MRTASHGQSDGWEGKVCGGCTKARFYHVQGYSLFRKFSIIIIHRLQDQDQEYQKQSRGDCISSTNKIRRVAWAHVFSVSPGPAEH